jgi:hypothetical protein
MTTPSGQISMSNVNVELGRTSTSAINMNDPAVRALARKPTANSIISMNDLRNKKFIDFPGFNVSVFGFPSFGESASAQFTIYPYYETFFLGPEKNYAGFEISGFNTTVAVEGQWIPTEVASVIDDYQIRVTKTSGGAVSGTLNTWLNLVDGPYTWEVSEFYPNSNAASLQVDFRNASTTTIVETGVVNLQAGF